MPRYIIHIGPPKSGSKYLQSQLFHARPWLLERGICYPDLWWTKPDQILHDSLFELLKEGKEDIKPAFERLNHSGHQLVVLSCEGFDDLAVDKLEMLRDAIGENPVEIVYYVRRWSDRIPSDWRQRCMMGQFQTLPEFYIFYLNDPEGTGEINYSLVWKRFASVFGREALQLVSYDNLRENHVDIFDHFCHTLLSLSETPLIPSDLIQANISPGMYETEILRVLNYKNFLETGVLSKFMRVKFLTLKEQLDLEPLKELMSTDLREISMRDDAHPLESTWQQICEFEDRLLSPEHGKQMFERRQAKVSYVGPNYLLRSGALRALETVYQILCDTPVSHPELE